MPVLLEPPPPSVAADVAFLRDRCVMLQRALTLGADPSMVDEEAFEGDVLRRWTRILVVARPRSLEAQLALEELYVLHAKVLERIARGGVGDIAKDVECLVRALLVDQLQRATERAVDHLG